MKTRFIGLAILLALTAAFGAFFGLNAEEPAVDENLVALISDLHVGVNEGKPDYAQDNDKKLNAVVDKILAMNPRPAAVIIYGDIAYEKGTKADYELVRPILARFDEAKIPWYPAFGNHDRRAPFAEVFPEKSANTEVAGRLVTTVKTPRADFILLDSLLEGEVATAQDPILVEWLAKKLAEEEQAGRRVYVGAHHPSDEAGLLETLEKSPAVCGYIFGHWHKWSRPEKGSVAHFCLPSTAYKRPPLGFMTLSLGETEDVFTLITNDADDENNGALWRHPVAAARPVE